MLLGGQAQMTEPVSSSSSSLPPDGVGQAVVPLGASDFVLIVLLLVVLVFVVPKHFLKLLQHTRPCR